MSRIIWDDDVELIELDRYCFHHENVNHNTSAEYVRWSPDNRLLSVNLMERIIVYELNVNYCFKKVELDHNKSGKLRRSDIIPRTSYNDLAKFLPEDLCYVQRNRFEMKTLRHQQRFVSFEFSPLQPTKKFNFIATLTDHDQLDLYLNRVSQQWLHHFDVTENFSKQIWNIEPPDPMLTVEMSTEDYFRLLSRIRISAFVWHPRIRYDNKMETEFSYRMFLSTRDSRVHLVEFKVDSLGEFSFKIIRTWTGDLGKIITLKVIDPILLIQSNDGRVTAIDLELSESSTINIWTKKDKRPSFNFAFERIDENIIQILFSKYHSIVVAKMIMIDGHTRLHSVKEIIFSNLSGFDLNERFSDIFAVFNIDSYYCFSTLSGDLFAFKLTTESMFTGAILIRKMKISSFNSEDQYHCCVASSGNGAMVVILAKPSRFSYRQAQFKSDSIRLYFTTTLELNTVPDILTRHLLLPNGNLADFLHLFRCTVNRRDCSIDHFRSLMDFLLKRVPVWMVQHQNATDDNLKTMKFIRNAVRYCLSTGKFDENNDEIQRLERLLERLNFLIAQNWFGKVLMSAIQKKPWKEWMKIEHLISAYNAINSGLLNPSIIDKNTILEIEKLAKSSPKNCPYSSVDPDKKLTAGMELNKQFNCCPYPCRCIIDDTAFQVIGSNGNMQDKKNTHQLDIDSNTLLVLDPRFDQIEQCYGCLESKLSRPSLWIDPCELPFLDPVNDDSFGTSCLFCL